MTDYNALSDQEFRAEVYAFFDAMYPRHLRFLPRRLLWAECREWYQTLSRKGWIAPNWPREYGGMGLAPTKLIIYMEEAERVGVGRMPDQGIIIVGPTLIRFGSDAQREQFLPRIIDGEHIWCQGYSEPNAGSDLASLRTEAVLEGDDFIINGSKIWTGMAHQATHIYMLVRTDKQAKKQEGISFLLVDMKAPGITIRPIRDIAGHEELCQVFFDNVRTPRANLVGEINHGWTIAKGLLGFERLNTGSPRRPLQALEKLEALARARGLLDEPAFRERFIALRLDLEDLGSLYSRYVEKVRRGEALGPDVSMLKIWAMETYQRLSEFLIESADEYGAIKGNLLIEGEAIDALGLFFNARPGTIYGGSNEIQRNILAKHILNLPS